MIFLESLILKPNLSLQIIFLLSYLLLKSRYPNFVPLRHIYISFKLERIEIQGNMR